MTLLPVRTFCLLLLCLGSTLRQGNTNPNALNLQAPNGIALEGRNNIYVSDIAAHRILKIDARGETQIIAGTGEAGFSGDSGPAKQAQLSSPHDLIFDAQGNLIIADSGNHRIRRIDRDGTITTIAGDGKGGKAGYNESAPPGSLSYPQGLAIDAAGNLLIADTYNHVVRKLDSTGNLAIFAGSVAGYGGDGGPATRAQISLPMAVAVAPDGSVYISDAGNSRIRKVTPDGRIQTVAGYGPAQDTYGGGYAGEGVPLEKAKLFSATDLKCDSKGNLYIVDSGNHRVRVVREGIITTLAGSGEAGMKNDGRPAGQAELNSPQKLALAGDGSVFITDRANRCIRKVALSGIISTIHGTYRPVRSR